MKLMSLTQLMMKMRSKEDWNEMDEEIVEGQDGDDGDNSNEEMANIVITGEAKSGTSLWELLHMAHTHKVNREFYSPGHLEEP